MHMFHSIIIRNVFRKISSRDIPSWWVVGYADNYTHISICMTLDFEEFQVFFTCLFIFASQWIHMCMVNCLFSRPKEKLIYLLSKRVTSSHWKNTLSLKEKLICLHIERVRVEKKQTSNPYPLIRTRLIPTRTKTAGTHLGRRQPVPTRTKAKH